MKMCVTCKKPIIRKMRTNGYLEVIQQYSKRKFCNNKCKGKYLSILNKGKVFHSKSPFVKGHKIKGGVETQFKVGRKPTHKRPSGSEHYNWKGGVTTPNEKIRKSKKYKEWRAKILKRDNYTCRFCKQYGGKLSVDHIKPFSLFPDLRFEDSNARVLCWECHKKTDTFAGKVRNYA